MTAIQNDNRRMALLNERGEVCAHSFSHRLEIHFSIILTIYSTGASQSFFSHSWIIPISP